LFVILALCSIALAADAQVLGPQNLVFDNGDLGVVPAGWFVPTPGYTARVIAEGAAPGKRAVELALSDPATQSPFGNLMQTFDAARPLTSRGLRNEVAFARLLGYIRYFHPSDEGAKTDWASFAIRGARAIESAKDDEELAQQLVSLFEPVSPALRVLPGGRPYERPAGLNPPAGDPEVT